MCHCGYSKCNLWNPLREKYSTNQITLKYFIQKIIKNVKLYRYDIDWPGTYWIKVTFNLSKENSLKRKYIDYCINNEYIRFVLYQLLNKSILYFKY